LGRKRIAFAAGAGQFALLGDRPGETDLIYLRGQFYLAATCNVEEPEVYKVNNVLGVDLGVINIATDSDGKHYSGTTVNNVRRRHRRLRQKLQKCGTRSAHRHLQRLSGKETRFATNTNHVIAKQIVAGARRTGRGIAVENLTGIRGRIRARRRQRAALHF
jgi:transposase